MAVDFWKVTDSNRETEIVAKSNIVSPRTYGDTCAVRHLVAELCPFQELDYIYYREALTK